MDGRTWDVWQDPRVMDFPCRKPLLAQIARRADVTPIGFDLECSGHQGLATHCIPILFEKDCWYGLALTHLENKSAARAVFQLLAANLKLVLSHVQQAAELKRMSDSLRPRMVALSTVHTIHRLINTISGLDDLYARLATLTGQVIRAKECVIYSADKRTPGSRLTERGNTVVSLRGRAGRKVRSGEGLEGRVYATAKHVLRKDVLSVPIIDEDVIGVITLRRKKDSKGFDFFDKDILMTLAEEAVVAIKNAELYEEQKRVTVETIRSLATILGTRFSPQRKVRSSTLLSIAMEMADLLRLNEADKQALHYATLLKDAGKFSLPDAIFKKTAKLTGEEVKLVRQHPVHGAKLVQSFNSLKPVAPILLASHENFDGSGYPNGLKGRQIPLGSRMLAVLNAFEALIGGRPYKQGTSIEQAFEELRRNRGTQFDPQVVDVFERVVRMQRMVRLLRHEGFRWEKARS
jgi:response regulator RpfG family c-di-GMP phosphodiesterase